MKTRLQLLTLALLVPLAVWAQVNSGSNGSDGAFNPTNNTVITPGQSSGPDKTLTFSRKQ